MRKVAAQSQTFFIFQTGLKKLLERERGEQGRVRKDMNTPLYRNVKTYIQWGEITVQIIGCVRKMFSFPQHNLRINAYAWEAVCVCVCRSLQFPDGQ